MEGLYLHNLIFLALFSDSSAITLYVILGWGRLTDGVAAMQIYINKLYYISDQLYDTM